LAHEAVGELRGLHLARDPQLLPQLPLLLPQLVEEFLELPQLVQVEVREQLAHVHEPALQEELQRFVDDLGISSIRQMHRIRRHQEQLDIQQQQLLLTRLRERAHERILQDRQPILATESKLH
jgi:hypothetical protein